MITSASLYTFEIDDHDKALEEIQAQLSEKLVLKKYTAGIIHCTVDYLESGVLTYICEALEFPVIGATTTSQAVNDKLGKLMLTIMVMTSDDVQFVPARTNGLTHGQFAAIEQSCPSDIIPDLPLRLILAFPPLKDEYSGDTFVTAFESVYGNVPVFGALSIEEEIFTYTRNFTIYNGEYLENEVTYLLLYGDINPRFFITNVPQRSNLFKVGTITKAEGNIIHEIDGMKTVDFFEHIGYSLSGVGFVPLVLTLQDSPSCEPSQFVRGLVEFDENGSALCRGKVYENAILTIGSNSVDDIIAASKNTTELLNKEKDVQTALIYSCVVRRTVLINNPEIELETVYNTIRHDIPFMMAYAGGELCPNHVSENSAVNRFHNFSLIACVF